MIFNQPMSGDGDGDNDIREVADKSGCSTSHRPIRRPCLSSEGRMTEVWPVNGEVENSEDRATCIWAGLDEYEMCPV